MPRPPANRLALLTDDLAEMVMARLDGASLGWLAQVDRSWRRLAQGSEQWGRLFQGRWPKAHRQLEERGAAADSVKPAPASWPWHERYRYTLLLMLTKQRERLEREQSDRRAVQQTEFRRWSELGGRGASRLNRAVSQPAPLGTPSPGMAPTFASWAQDEGPVSATPYTGD